MLAEAYKKRKFREGEAKERRKWMAWIELHKDKLEAAGIDTKNLKFPSDFVSKDEQEKNANSG